MLRGHVSTELLIVCTAAFLSHLDKKPAKSWPSEGAIMFDKLYLRYSKVEGPVLKNLTFAIEAKQKVCACSGSVINQPESKLLLEGLAVYYSISSGNVFAFS